MAQRCLLLLALALLVPLAVSAQTAEVTFDRGLVSIQCRNAPLSRVFEELEKAAGVELILEDAVKSKRLTADLVDVPVTMAVQRLLEGMGVNYAVMMDPRDWGRVDKVFVGAGGGGPARQAPPPRRAPVRPAPDAVEDYDELDDTEDVEDYQDFDDMDDMEDELEDPNADPGAFPPPGSSPIPNYLPPQQSFPRSNFTPGLPNNQTQPQRQPQQPQANPSTPPPATFPFMDALGRPIPVPPDMNQQQQQRRERQQQQQQQQ